MKETFLRIVGALVAAVVLVFLGVWVFGKFSPSEEANLGTALTINTQNQSYTEGADFKQNVQAIAERMAGVSQYQVLQADSQGRMQAVAPTALAGVFTFNRLEPSENVATDNVIATTETGKTFYLSGATSTQTLAIATSTVGQTYRFVVAGSVTGDITIVTSDASNIIEGTLIVAGAVVDCDDEDTITIKADGENVGDFVELRTDGSKWFIGESGALTASKMTCTAT